MSVAAAASAEVPVAIESAATVDHGMAFKEEGSPMYFRFEPANYDEILRHYDESGFVVLTDVDPRIADGLRAIIGRVTGLSADQIRAASQSDQELELPVEVRNELARPQVTDELQRPLLDVFGDFVLKMLGPIVHISRDFHPQIKRGSSGVILQGYSGTGLEVEAAYGFHTDFTAGRVMTSPSAVVFWTPLNTCNQNGLRLYRRSHANGLLTNRWLPPGTEGIERLGEHVDVTAVEGQTLVFNFALLHGTSLGGPRTRISADLRFFPYCGILDNPPYVLTPDPIGWIRGRLTEGLGETLLAPLYETLAYLGQPIDWPPIGQYSLLNWARLIEAELQGDKPSVRSSMQRLANTDIGFDPLDSYVERYATLQLSTTPYQTVLPKLAAADRELAQRLLKSQALVN